jgi:hypothetical protein
MVLGRIYEALICLRFYLTFKTLKSNNTHQVLLTLPAISLDSPGSLTIKIRPLGADANSFSSLASKGSGAPVVVPLACVGVPPGKTNPVTKDQVP